MSKIWKLFIDENIKTWKKLSTKILLIVILISLVGILGLVKIIQKTNNSYEINSSGYDWRQETESQIGYIEESLENPQIDEESKNMMEQELQTLKLSLKYDINPYENIWKNEIIRKIVDLQFEENIKEAEIADLTKKLEDNDFNGYIQMQKQELKQELDDKLISQVEYDDKIMILELKEKYEVGKTADTPFWKTAAITNIENAQNSNRTNMDENNKVLTAEKKQENEDSIKMNIYRLEHNMPQIEYSENYRTIFEYLSSTFVISAIAITAIVIAGGMISTEVSTGTIKFWALTPNKRWKILTAKILSLLFYIIIITVIASLISVILSNVFFAETGEPYIYVENGEVQTIGNTLYTVLTYLAKMIPVIIFALFALMLSVITRNTAVSVSFSVAIYMGNSIFMAILNQFITKDWIRFVPFNNLNISEKIFENATNLMAINAESFATSTSLGFSLGVLGVCAILMLVTMYDSFNKRDII